MSDSKPSIIGALGEPVFKSLWLASLLSNIGTWMQNTAGAWLMLTFSSSSLNIALMQTATTIPALLVSIPVSAMADLVDRRKLLLYIQGFMFLASGMLSLFSYLQLLNASVLLFFTFLLGMGAAMNNPVWQVITPDIISKKNYTAGVALSGASVNLARAIGPSISGVLVSMAGVQFVFLINTISFLAVIYSVYKWKIASEAPNPKPEHLLQAIKTGLGYVNASKPYKTILLRAFAFIISGSALWALIPVIAKNELHLSANGYGITLGCLGIGSLIGTIILPNAMSRYRLNNLLITGSVTYAATISLIVLFPTPLLAYSLLLFTGIAWIFVLSILNVEAQKMAPGWVRARALGIYTLIFQGGMGLTSIAWGMLAQVSNVKIAILSSAIGIIAGVLLTLHFKIENDVLQDGHEELTQAGHLTTLTT